ncbi:hypothetical protein [Cellulomonas sp.]|uniref:hypothetical protein n=1 Tax=Cellulomonas sp. TaxID=40001 RepID=UPI0025876D82|nr:hypothetical protein [Cellulomonas sp.]MCR6688486.1 hypothetical protein [Cellulomonas sp.]
MGTTTRASLAAAALLVVAGCTAGPDAGGAAATAVALAHRVAAGDGAAACRLLAPTTVERLEHDSGLPCAQAVLALDLPTTLPGARGESFGRQAQVRSSADVVFLVRSGDAWLVTAAGCTPRGDRPYDCDLEGG